MSSRHGEYVARALLLDRLVDLEPTSSREPRPLRSLTYDQLLASLRKEIETLFNTRSALTLDQLSERDLTVIDYGSSDLSWLSPMATDDRARVSAALAHIISAFEPRLRDVSVVIETFDTNARMLYATISGQLHTEHLSEPVSFPVTLHPTHREPGSHGL